MVKSVEVLTTVKSFTYTESLASALCDWSRECLDRATFLRERINNDIESGRCAQPDEHTDYWLLVITAALSGNLPLAVEALEYHTFARSGDERYRAALDLLRTAPLDALTKGDESAWCTWLDLVRIATWEDRRFEDMHELEVVMQLISGNRSVLDQVARIEGAVTSWRQLLTPLALYFDGVDSVDKLIEVRF